MTHQLTGINLDKAKEMAHAALDQSVVFTELEGMITGKYYEVSGNNTGRYLIVKKIAPVTMNLNAAQIEAAVEAV
jgi:ssDNA-binding replication factor A large subunit